MMTGHATTAVDGGQCPICGHRALERPAALARAIRVEPPQALQRCRRCGFGWVDADEQAAPLTYEGDYFEQYRQADSFQGGVDRLPAHLEARLETLAATIGAPGTLLDVGVGFGTFVDAARRRGWRASGLDVSTWAAEHARRTYGVDVQVAAIQEAGLANGAFDVVHLNHTLEHLDDPIGDLRCLRQALSPRGVLVAEVPNEVDDLFESIRWSLMGRRTPPCTERNPHGRFFNAASLQLALQAAGFRVERLTSERRNESHDSRIPLGAAVKRAVYVLERRTLRGPNLVAWARPVA